MPDDIYKSLAKRFTEDDEALASGLGITQAPKPAPKPTPFLDRFKETVRKGLEGGLLTSPVPPQVFQALRGAAPAVSLGLRQVGRSFLPSEWRKTPEQAFEERQQEWEGLQAPSGVAENVGRIGAAMAGFGRPPTLEELQNPVAAIGLAVPPAAIASGGLAAAGREARVITRPVVGALGKFRPTAPLALKLEGRPGIGGAAIKLEAHERGSRIKRFLDADLQSRYQATNEAVESAGLRMDALAGTRPDEFFVAIDTPASGKVLPYNKGIEPPKGVDSDLGVKIVAQNLQGRRLFFKTFDDVATFLKTGVYERPVIESPLRPGPFKALYETEKVGMPVQKWPKDVTFFDKATEEQREALLRRAGVDPGTVRLPPYRNPQTRKMVERGIPSFEGLPLDVRAKVARQAFGGESSLQAQAARKAQVAAGQVVTSRQAGAETGRVADGRIWLTGDVLEAANNTPGAVISPDGLSLDVVRYQKPEQAGARAIRSGVFYLPEKKSPYQRYYTTGKLGYGGTERFEGRTTYRNPIVVKAASGGRGPQLAYDTLNGKGAYEKMRSDVLKTTVRFGREGPNEQEIAELLSKYGGDPNFAYDILAAGRKGNTLPYAIQEHIVAASMRKNGYDAVLSYQKMSGKPARLSEVFDVRAEEYPWQTPWENMYTSFYSPSKPRVPAAPVEMPVTKEPWQMTQAEHKEWFLRGTLQEYSTEDLALNRKDWVAKALSEGKPVPAEVLAEYPDLAKQAPARPAPKPPKPAEARPDARRRNPADVAAEMKAEGIGRQESWSRWVQRTSLQPGMDAKDWYKIYDSVSPGMGRQAVNIPAAGAERLGSSSVLPSQAIPEPELVDFGKRIEVKTQIGRNQYEWRPATVERTLNQGSAYEIRVPNPARPGMEGGTTTLRVQASDVRGLEPAAPVEPPSALAKPAKVEPTLVKPVQAAKLLTAQQYREFLEQLPSEIPDAVVPASNLRPPHEVRDTANLATIEASMKKAGYRGRPILASGSPEDAQAFTGSHRIAAATRLRHEVPVVFVDDTKLRKYLDSNEMEFDEFNALDRDQLEKAFRDMGDERAANLMGREGRIEDAKFVSQATINEALAMSPASKVPAAQPLIAEAATKVPPGGMAAAPAQKAVVPPSATVPSVVSSTPPPLPKEPVTLETAVPPSAPVPPVKPPLGPPIPPSPDLIGTGGPSREPGRGITEALAQAKAIVDRDRPGTVTRIINATPGLGKVQAALHPSVRMPEHLTASWIGDANARSAVSTKLNASTVDWLAQLDSAFGKGAVSGKAKARVRFIGAPEEQTPFSRTLYDVMQRPQLYGLDDAQRALLTRIQSEKTAALRQMREAYNLKIGEFPTEEGSVHLANVDRSKEAIDTAGSLESALRRGRAKERVYATGADRWRHDKTFDPVVDVGLLLQADNEALAQMSGKNVFMEGSGGLTKLQVLERTHPELYESMMGVRKRLEKIKGYQSALETQIQEVIDDFLASPMADEDLATLQTELSKGLKPGRFVAKAQAGKQTGALRAEWKAVREELADLQPAWRTANTKGYRLVQEGNIFRYYPVAEAEQVSRLMQSSKNTALRVLDELRATAFAGDLSPASIQGATAMFSDPVRVGRWIASAQTKQGGLVGQVSLEAMAADMRANSESWQRFTLATGLDPLRGMTSTEFSTGYLARIPRAGQYWAKFNDVVYRPLTRLTKDAFDSLYADGLRRGLNPEQAAAVAGDDVTKWIPHYSYQRLGMSQAEGARYRSMLTSVSFLTQPAALMSDATKGLIKMGALRKVTPSESYAVKRLVTVSALVGAVSALSHAAYAVSQKQDPGEAVKDSWDPSSPWFASLVLPNGARLGLGGPYRSLIKAIYPRQVQTPLGTRPVPFAGLHRFALSKMGPGVRIVYDEVRNRDYFSREIRTGKFPLNILQGLEYAAESAVPLSVGTAAQTIRQGKPAGEVATQVGSQFAGVNYVPEDKVYMAKLAWNDDLEAYRVIPSNDLERETKRRQATTPEERQKYSLSRIDYRKRHPDVDAKLFLVGDVSSLQSYQAMTQALKLIRERGLNPDDVKSIKARKEYKEQAKKANIAVSSSLVDILIAQLDRTPSPSASSALKTTPPATPSTTSTQTNTWEDVRKTLGVKGLTALSSLWFEGKEPTPEQDVLLRSVFAKHSLGQASYNVWLKQRLRQLYEKSIKIPATSLR